MKKPNVDFIRFDGMHLTEDDLKVNLSHCRNADDILEVIHDGMKRNGIVVIEGDEDIPWMKELNQPEYEQKFQIGDIVKINPRMLEFACVNATNDELNKKYMITGVKKVSDTDFSYEIKEIGAKNGEKPLEWFLNGNEIILVISGKDLKRKCMI